MARQPLPIDRYIKPKANSPHFNYVRRVPTDITAITGKKWESRSLSTGDLNKARIFAQAINNDLERSWNDIRRQGHIRTLDKDDQGVLNGWKLDAYFESQEMQTMPEADMFNRFIELMQQDQPIEGLKGSGWQIKTVDLKEAGEIRRQIILDRIISDQKEKRIEEINAISTPGEFLQTFTKPKQIELGAPKLSTIMEEMFIEKPPTGRQGEERMKAVRQSVNGFISFLGDKPVNHYKKREVLDFINRLERYPVKPSGAFVNASFKTITDATHPKTLTQVAATEWFTRIQSVFLYARALYSDDFNITNPFEGLSRFIKGRESIVKEPFSPKQLASIFTHKAFLSDDVRKWISILCLYQGARMNEFLPRSYSDFYEDENGLFVVKIWKDENSEANASVKNDPSNRIIPIHDKVLALGFRVWLDQRKQDGWKFPFSEFKDQIPDDHRFSKNFGRFLKTVEGITESTTFHSFRHNFASVAEAKLLSEVAISKIQGHKVGRIHADIYTKLTPKEMKPILDQIEFEGVPF